MSKTPTTLATTPESVPSLADSSVDTHDIARALFHTPPSQEKRESDTGLWEDISDANESDTVASLDLAISSALLLGRGSSRFKNPEASHFSRTRNLVNPPPDESNVQAQLTNFFSMLNGNQKSSFWLARSEFLSNSKVPLDDDETLKEDSGDDKPITYEGWQGRAESLERECVALKEIIKVDSANILDLKGSLEALKNAEKRHRIEIEVLTAELKSTKRRLEQAEQDNAARKEREREHNDAIVILKEEINRLTDRASEAVDPNEVQRLQFENELFAAQIVDNERQLKRVQVELAIRQAELEGVQLELEESKVDSSLIDELLGLENSDALEIMGKVDRLSDKLYRMETSYRSELEEKDSEIAEIKRLLLSVMEKQQQQDCRDDRPEVALPVQLVEKEEEIEILTKTLCVKDAEIKELKDKIENEEDRRCRDCIPFSSFCLTGHD